MFRVRVSVGTFHGQTYGVARKRKDAERMAETAKHYGYSDARVLPVSKDDLAEDGNLKRMVKMYVT